jgi:hypothetical protein
MKWLDVGGAVPPLSGETTPRRRGASRRPTAVTIQSIDGVEAA